jgi:vitamin B12 transporter
MFYRLFIALFISVNCIAQQDSTQLIELMEVSYIPVLKVNSNELKSKEIQEMAAEDAGELIRKFAGVSLKSYGGLGGLKTVSMRGLGANHSAIVSDGFSLTNNQTGQVNLGQIQAENITNFVSVLGTSSSFIQPISAQIGGSSFIIETFENSFSDKKLKIRSSLKYGSFNQKNGYLGVKYAPNKFQFSVFGTYRDSEGNYPYSFQNGYFGVNEVRKNNDYQDYNFGGTVGFKSKKITFRVGYKKTNINQGLPGAVIFYNQTQDERLTTNSDLIFGDVVHVRNKFKLRGYASASSNSMNYLDPTYFNSAGRIDVDYHNRNVTGGLSLNHELKGIWELFGGIEMIVSDLKTNDSTFALPVRVHNFALLGTRIKFNKIKFEISASSQYVHEKNNNGIRAKDRFRLNPFVSITGNPMDNKWIYEIWYRNSFRMPTFNELYYNNIGNNLLEPEDAHQFNVGLGYAPRIRKFLIKIKANAFYNRVDNKIVAIPTKNLFVWSMQNIGKTDIFGAEGVLSVDWKFHSKWKLSSDGNYSFQKTVDVTDRNSPTYGDQIAYIPLHTANLDVAVYFQKTGIRISSNFVSERYALNENVAANKIDGFVTADISVFHQFKIKNVHSLQLQANVKNVFNNSYAYIRSYVMPGINYLISLSYAFN